MHFNVQIIFNLVGGKSITNIKYLTQHFSDKTCILGAEEGCLDDKTKDFIRERREQHYCYGCNCLRDLVKRGRTHMILTTAKKMPGGSGGKP